jgi:hypothetical protein
VHRYFSRQYYTHVLHCELLPFRSTLSCPIPTNISYRYASQETIPFASCAHHTTHQTHTHRTLSHVPVQASMAGIIIIGVPLLLGCVVGPIVDLTLLFGLAATDMRRVGIAHGVACLAAVRTDCRVQCISTYLSKRWR